MLGLLKRMRGKANRSLKEKRRINSLTHNPFTTKNTRSSWPFNILFQRTVQIKQAVLKDFNFTKNSLILFIHQPHKADTLLNTVGWNVHSTRDGCMSGRSTTEPNVK